MFTGFICEATGETVTPQSCLACARRGALPGCHMTEPVVRGIIQNLRPPDFGLTVTTLLSCPRKERLKSQVDYCLKPSEAFWLFRGQVFHSGLAAYATAQDIHEERFLILVEAPHGLVEVSGQPDLVYLDKANRRLLDYKTTNRLPAEWKSYICPQSGAVIQEGTRSVRTRWITCPYCPEERHQTKQVERKSPPRARPRDALQLSLYRLLLAEHGIEIERGEIVYLDMRRLMRIPVELLRLDEAQRLLETRVALHTQPELPPPLADPEEVWECEWCPLREACEKRSGEPVGMGKQVHLKTFSPCQEIRQD
jgi:CRISPR/Cas system-associated exonuclease Cas4 (RecB family)